MFTFLADVAANVPATPDIAPVIAPPPGSPPWMQIVFAILSFLVMSLLVPWLRQLTAKASAEAQEKRANATAQNLNSKDVLLAQAKAFALDTAASIAEKRFPALQEKIVKGELKADFASLKSELRSWGQILKDKIVEHFAAQGIDVVVALGDKYLDDLVEWAANKVSPFPGRDTVVSLLKDFDGKALQFLATKGVEWVKNRINLENTAPDTK